MPIDTSQLPPKPDPYTGQPRPPAAPLEEGSKRRPPEDLDRLEHGQTKVPGPPDGQGPMLEWFYANRTSRVFTGLMLSGLVLLTYVIKDWGFSWVSLWYLWLVAVPWPFLFLWSGRNERHSVGAEWLAVGNKAWIRLYELNKIKITTAAGGMAQKLEITDSNGRGLMSNIGNLQDNPRLWDLVYNGLIHSYHLNNPETNKRARNNLQLEYPPTAVRAP